MSQKHVTLPLAWLAAAALLTACALPPAPPPKAADTNMPTQTQSTPNTLAGSDWVLESLGGNTPVAGTQVTLNFIDATRVAGSDGCNRFTGGYTADGASLKFGLLGSTMMACSDPIMQQANAFSRALAETQTFAIANARLSLKDKGGATLAIFASVNTNLAGTKWDVTNFNNGKQAVIGVIEGTKLTLAFGDDGIASGSAGCNNFTGGYQQSNDTIAIGPLGSTRKLCSEPAGVMDQETQFLKALESAATVQFDGDMLTLRTKDDAMAVVMRRAP